MTKLQQKKQQQGFTLLELMIAVVILALLATLAYPSYQSFVRKSRLQNVRATLAQNAQLLERYYAQKRNFTDFDEGNLVQNDYFTLSLPKKDEIGYELEAIPKASHIGETCHVFLNSSGIFYAKDPADSNQECPGYEVFKVKKSA